MKFISYYVKRLKMKFFYSPKNYDHNLADPELHKKVETLKSHYSLEQRDVNTSQGVGNIYTPITHHDNNYLPEELHGKHIYFLKYNMLIFYYNYYFLFKYIFLRTQ